MGRLQTLLFVPANHLQRMTKAFEMPVDAVVMDLEDACAESEKPQARRNVTEYTILHSRPLAYVRVNPVSSQYFFDDLTTLVPSAPDGIILPMIDTPSDVEVAEWMITTLEARANLPERGIDVIPIIETARGLSNLTSILNCADRVKRVALGAADLSNDTGMTLTPSGAELEYARSRIVIESRAADIDGPIDTAYIDLADLDGLANETRRAKECGFHGKILIHPNQIDTVKTVFMPSEIEVAHAKEIVKAFKIAEAKGSSSIRVGNTFVDYPVAYRAQQVLEIAGD